MLQHLTFTATSPSPPPHLHRYPTLHPHPSPHPTRTQSSDSEFPQHVATNNHVDPYHQHQSPTSGHGGFCGSSPSSKYHSLSRLNSRTSADERDQSDLQVSDLVHRGDLDM